MVTVPTLASLVLGGPWLVSDRARSRGGARDLVRYTRFGHSLAIGSFILERFHCCEGAK